MRGHLLRLVNPVAIHLLILLVTSLCMWCAGAESASAEAAEGAVPDKSGYNLFTPTPDKMMRELSPDRPDKTESPYTVDAGHLQLEMSFVEFTRDQSDGLRTKTWNALPLNLKAGLFNNVDLQLILINFLAVRTEDLATGSTENRSGFGDSYLRLKVNLWGNDGGKTAFALLPFVKFPTNSNHLGNNSVEGGVILPLAVKLPGGWDLGLETAPVFLRNAESSGYHSEFINTVTVSHDLIGKLGGYLEFFSSVSTEQGSDWVGTLDLGLTFDVTKNLQLDCGVNLGVTRSANDLNAFAGITTRY